MPSSRQATATRFWEPDQGRCSDEQCAREQREGDTETLRLRHRSDQKRGGSAPQAADIERKPLSDGSNRRRIDLRGDGTKSREETGTKECDDKTKHEESPRIRRDSVQQRQER